MNVHGQSAGLLSFLSVPGRTGVTGVVSSATQPDAEEGGFQSLLSGLALATDPALPVVAQTDVPGSLVAPPPALDLAALMQGLLQSATPYSAAPLAATTSGDSALPRVPAGEASIMASQPARLAATTPVIVDNDLTVAVPRLALPDSLGGSPGAQRAVTPWSGEKGFDKPTGVQPLAFKGRETAVAVLAPIAAPLPAMAPATATPPSSVNSPPGLSKEPLLGRLTSVAEQLTAKRLTPSTALASPLTRIEPVQGASHVINAVTADGVARQGLFANGAELELTQLPMKSIAAWVPAPAIEPETATATATATATRPSSVNSPPGLSKEPLLGRLTPVAEQLTAKRLTPSTALASPLTRIEPVQGSSHVINAVTADGVVRQGLFANGAELELTQLPMKSIAAWVPAPAIEPAATAGAGAGAVQALPASNATNWVVPMASVVPQVATSPITGDQVPAMPQGNMLADAVTSPAFDAVAPQPLVREVLRPMLAAVGPQPQPTALVRAAELAPIAGTTQSVEQKATPATQAAPVAIAATGVVAAGGAADPMHQPRAQDQTPIVWTQAAPMGGGFAEGDKARVGLPGEALWRQPAQGPGEARSPSELNGIAPALLPTQPAQSGWQLTSRPVVSVAETGVAEQVSYWVSQGVHHASLTIDGLANDPLQVNISLSGKEAHIEFRAEQPETRLILENSVQQLRESLGREGLVLSGVTIGGSGLAWSGERGAAGGQAPVHAPPASDGDVEVEPVHLATSTAVPQRSERALDVFA